MSKQFTLADTFFQQWDRGDKSFELNTSGTTGLPRKIRHSRDALIWSAQATRNAWFNAQTFQPLSQLCCLPVDKAGGMMQLVRSRVWGEPLYLVEPSSNPLMTEFPPAHVTSLTPMQLEAIVENPISSQKLSNFRAVLIGGQALNPILEMRLLKMFPMVQFIHTFGSTETASHFAGRLIGSADSVFTVIGSTQIRVNTQGELEILNPVTQEKWITTHDLAEITSPNSFCWLGRSNCIINSGGVKIQLEMLEMEIAKISGWPINSFYCVGIPDRLLGEKLMLKTLERKDTIEEMFVILSVLPKLHQPKEIVFVTEIPLSVTGKIRR